MSFLFNQQQDQNKKDLSLNDVIVKVTNMVSYDSKANQLAKQKGLDINYVSWEGMTMSIIMSYSVSNP